MTARNASVRSPALPEGMDSPGDQGREEWLSRALQRNPEVKLLRERILPLQRSLAFAEIYRPGQAAVRHQLTEEHIVKLILQHLSFYEFHDARQALEKEAKISCSPPPPYSDPRTPMNLSYAHTTSLYC